MAVALLLIPVGIGRMQAALACTCIPNQGAADHLAQADVVFDGIVTQQSPPPADPFGQVSYRFDVTNVVKGTATNPQDVTTSADDGLCGTSFGLGRAYRVFARRNGETLSTHSCSGNQSLSGSPPTGYRLAAADGGVFSFGRSSFHGSAGGLPLNAPVVGIAATPSNGGYWLAAADGGVFAFGGARFLGSTAGVPLNAPVVGITPSPTGQGYWLTAADGGVFAYGDARFFGSAGSLRLNAPVVGIAATGSGAGYWLLGADGGIFAYGNAGYYGRTTYISHPVAGGEGRAIGQPAPPRGDQQATGITATHRGTGYWISSYVGGTSGFGDTAPLEPYQSAGVVGAVGIARTSVGDGLALASAAGQVATYNATYLGDVAGQRLNAPVVGVSS